MTTRIAAHGAVCANRDCPHLIYQGSRITKPGPGRGWTHADCAKPARRGKDSRDAGHAATVARRRR